MLLYRVDIDIIVLNVPNKLLFQNNHVLIVDKLLLIVLQFINEIFAYNLIYSNNFKSIVY